jgi:hypothetical protein
VILISLNFSSFVNLLYFLFLLIALVIASSKIGVMKLILDKLPNLLYCISFEVNLLFINFARF